MIDLIRKRAEDLEFLAIGFSRPGDSPFYDHFAAWISQGRQADMSWLERNMEVRRNPERLLRGCRTIISMAYPYPSQKPSTADGFTVSRYAHPREEDYHQRLKRVCREIAALVEMRYRGSRTRICVDSVPFLERSIAWKAGIGFFGKNNMLILPDYGSYFYLAEILCTAHLEFEPAVFPESQCGSCTLCLDACPTGALEGPFSFDAAGCLSYLTIEYGGAVNAEIGKRMGDCFFGCDRCQEACPFNKGEQRVDVSLPSTDAFLKMDEGEFRRRFGKTALARRGLEKIQSNIRAAGGKPPG